jgi:hypothetical protein
MGDQAGGSASKRRSTVCRRRFQHLLGMHMLVNRLHQRITALVGQRGNLEHRPLETQTSDHILDPRRALGFRAPCRACSAPASAACRNRPFVVLLQFVDDGLGLHHHGVYTCHRTEPHRPNAAASGCAASAAGTGAPARHPLRHLQSGQAHPPRQNSAPARHAPHPDSDAGW